MNETISRMRESTSEVVYIIVVLAAGSLLSGG